MGALKDTMLSVTANDKQLPGADDEDVGFVCAGTHSELS